MLVRSTACWMSSTVAPSTCEASSPANGVSEKSKPERTKMTEKRSAAYALAVLFLINTLNFFDRVIGGALGEPIRREFNLSDGALGALGTAFTLLYAFVGIPLGRLSDRGSRDRKSTRLNSSH